MGGRSWERVFLKEKEEKKTTKKEKRDVQGWVDLELFEPLASSERIVLSGDGNDVSRALFFIEVVLSSYRTFHN